MTLDQALRLIGMLTDTAQAQQEQINQLEKNIRALLDDANRLNALVSEEE